MLIGNSWYFQNVLRRNLSKVREVYIMVGGKKKESRNLKFSYCSYDYLLAKNKQWRGTGYMDRNSRLITLGNRYY